ncbi:hypothetical protein OG352_39855 (plasmid) [Streptomyces sp. NBC_01485]|uniref:hypothetical protein n=1 Tax=Streptomyces sp. NBC_01485 TaxID=2903884 RepID=UPI002E356BDE|nr:hypothetical protein [Streptomyces sp. NBC_01485]
MKRPITTAAVAAVVLAGTLAVPQASAAPPTRHASAPCATQWKAKVRVAVRRPAWNEGPVATPSSPVHHYLRRGDVVTSCVVAIGRTESGTSYQECGGGHLWRVVQGGQVPQGCLRKL